MDVVMASPGQRGDRAATEGSEDDDGSAARHGSLDDFGGFDSGGFGRLLPENKQRKSPQKRL
jgi:hypothetical protein